MEQIIKLTVYQKRDKVLATATEHAFDVDDIVSPIRFASGKSYFVAKSKTPKTHLAQTRTDFRVNETLDEVAVTSEKLVKLSVVSRHGVAHSEDMLFNITKVCETMYASAHGTSFLYNEEGDPSPMLYEVSNSVQDIINQSMLSGAIAWKKVRKTFADFSAAAMTKQVSVYVAKAKEMIHAVHALVIENFDSFDNEEVPAAIYTQYDMTVGIVGTVDKYVATVDLLANPTGALTAAVLTGPEVDMGAIVTIITELTTDANLNLANKGIVDYYILTSKLPQ